MLAFAIVGIGAAAYAPAKYGLITELVPPQRLVQANGWLEVTVVCAALLGVGWAARWSARGCSPICRRAWAWTARCWC